MVRGVVVWYVLVGVILAGLARREARLQVEYDDRDRMDPWFVFVLVGVLWGVFLVRVVTVRAWRAVRGG